MPAHRYCYLVATLVLLTLGACVETRPDPGYCGKCKPDAGTQLDARVPVLDGGPGALDGQVVADARVDGAVVDGAVVDGGDAMSADAGACGVLCEGSTAHCDALNAQCVECLSDTHCNAGSGKPACDQGVCVPCAQNSDCKTVSKPACDATAHVCVACMANNDCKAPAAGRCDTATHHCEACTADGQCTHLSATPVCEEAGGSCVECTPDAEQTACPDVGITHGPACDPSTLACSGAERGTLGFCQQCVSDSECITDYRCVAMKFKGADHGSYCLLDLTSYRVTISDALAECPKRQRVEKMATSVLGIETTYCGPRETLTTCEAVLGFGNTCTTGTDAPCGDPGISDDGICQGNKCTYECVGTTDCGNEVCSGGATTTCDPNM